MLQVHQKYENLINETFKNDPLFLSALDKACASVINSKLCDGKTTCRSAELVKPFAFRHRRELSFSFSFEGRKVSRQLAQEIKVDGKRNRDEAVEEHHNLQVHRGQGRVPKVLQPDVGKTVKKN